MRSDSAERPWSSYATSPSASSRICRRDAGRAWCPRHSKPSRWGGSVTTESSRGGLGGSVGAVLLSRALQVRARESEPGRARTKLSGEGAPGGASTEPGTRGQAGRLRSEVGWARACLGRGEEAPTGTCVLTARGTPTEPADHLDAQETLVAGARGPVFPGMEMCHHAPRDSVRGEESAQATDPSVRKLGVRAWRVAHGMWEPPAHRATVAVRWFNTQEELSTPCSSRLGGRHPLGFSPLTADKKIP